MLGQPSELRRRAAWEAVVGRVGLDGAGLEWADVEARVRVAERAVMRTVGSAVTGPAGPAGSAGALGAGGAAKVWTGDEVEAVKRGGVVDLGGREVALPRAAVVAGAGVEATVRNGTVVGVSVVDRVAFAVMTEAKLRLEGMRVVGANIVCSGRRQVTLIDTHVTETIFAGLGVLGHGSKGFVQGGRIVGSKDGHRVLCRDGGRLELRDVEISDFKECGVAISDKGSKVVMQGVHIVRSQEGHGLGCHDGGQAELRDVEVIDVSLCGLLIYGNGSKAVVHGGRIVGSKDGHGVLCRDGGRVELRDVEVADCQLNGVFVSGYGSKAVVRGGHISGSREGCGVYCFDGGQAEVRDVEITDCKLEGLLCDVGTLLHSGCVVSGCGAGSLRG